MEVSSGHNFPSIRGSDIFRTYASRFARLMYLKRVCSPDHSVLAVELDLVEMARSKLQEYIFTRIPADQIPLLRPILEVWVRALAQEKTLTLEDDDIIKADVLAAIASAKLDDLLPTLN